jgi:hypothetical protein
MPYDGMFLPPLPDDAWWPNDREGTQEKMNVSLGFIDAYYARTLASG